MNWLDFCCSKLGQERNWSIKVWVKILSSEIYEREWAILSRERNGLEKYYSQPRKSQHQSLHISEFFQNVSYLSVVIMKCRNIRIKSVRSFFLCKKKSCTNKFSYVFISRSWDQSWVMWHVSTLLGLIRHASGEKTFKSSACSHWMDSRVTLIQPPVRLWLQKFSKYQ